MSAPTACVVGAFYPHLHECWRDNVTSFDEEIDMSVTAALVKELREKSGAGMMDCKKALGETDGDMDAAID